MLTCKILFLVGIKNIIIIMQKLFSYGTLQDEKVQLATFGRKLKGKHDSMVGYKLSTLKITNPEVIKISGKDIHHVIEYTGNTKDEVNGMVFEVTADELSGSDKYEIADYERIEVDLKSGIKSYVYIKRSK